MRKSFCLIVMCLLVMAFLPKGALASGTEWQIICKENGSLQEVVRISGRDIFPGDTNWQQSQEGHQQIFYREVQNWETYQELKDKLPITVRQKNYIVYKKTELKISNQPVGGLFEQLDGLPGFNLHIEVPGFIMGSSADRTDVSLATWVMSDSAELLKETMIIKIINIDGLLLGIGIFIMGLLIIVKKFMNQIKKVEEIIEEEYSLEKVENADKKGET